MVSVLRVVIWTVVSVIFSDDPVKGSDTGTVGVAVGASVEHSGTHDNSKTNTSYLFVPWLHDVKVNGITIGASDLDY
jgi:hypothetical protein